MCVNIVVIHTLNEDLLMIAGDKDDTFAIVMINKGGEARKENHEGSHTHTYIYIIYIYYHILYKLYIYIYLHTHTYIIKNDTDEVPYL